MNKKAFTLVELMGVITVLGIITLLIAPTIINQIRNSKEKIDSVTEKLIYAATDLYLDNKENDYPKYNGSTYCVTLRDLVEDGKLSSPVLDSNGDEISLDKIIAVDVTNNNYNYRMPSSCEIKKAKTLSELIEGTNECTTNKTEGACALGTMFTINVNDSETKDFYVIKDDGTTVTLIMSENLGETISWYETAYDNSYGPTTAIDYLDGLTDDEWSNIPKKAYTYSGMADDDKTKKYEDLTRTMRARMITDKEVETIRAANNYTMPAWVHGNLYTSTTSSLHYGYWTSTATASYSDRAWFVNYGGLLGNTIVRIVESDGYGVRPVIELPK